MLVAKGLPAIYSWLNQYREKPIRRDDQGRYFWESRTCKYWEEFEKPEIILGRFMNHATFAYDKDHFYHNDALYMIPGTDEYVVSILNSSVSWWFLSRICPDLQNGHLQAYRENLFQIPITDANLRTQSLIKQLVSRIMRVKRKKEI